MGDHEHACLRNGTPTISSSHTLTRVNMLVCVCVKMKSELHDAFFASLCMEEGKGVAQPEMQGAAFHSHTERVKGCIYIHTIMQP